MLALAIAGAIEEELTKRGLRKVDGNPDVYIKMYGSVDLEMSVSYPTAIHRHGWYSLVRHRLRDVGLHARRNNCGHRP